MRPLREPARGHWRALRPQSDSTQTSASTGSVLGGQRRIQVLDALDLIEPDAFYLPRQPLQAYDRIGSLALLRIPEHLCARANSHDPFNRSTVAHVQCDAAMRGQAGNQPHQSLDIHFIRAHSRSFLAHTIPRYVRLDSV